MEQKTCENCQKSCDVTAFQCPCGYSFIDANVYPQDQAPRPPSPMPSENSLEDTLSLIQGIHNSYKGTSEGNEYVTGYRDGLRIAMNLVLAFLRKQGE